MKQETIHHYSLPIAAMFAHSVYVAFLLIVKSVKKICPHSSPYFRDTPTMAMGRLLNSPIILSDFFLRSVRRDIR